MTEPSARGPGMPARSEAWPERPGAAGAASGNGGTIVRLDDITVAPGRRAEFLELLESRYLPAARERGLDLAARHVSPPIDEPGFATNVLLTWRMTDVAGFWTARRHAVTDRGVVRFWKDAAPMIMSRTRRFAGGVASGSGRAPERGTPLPRAGRTHYLLLLRAPKSPAWSKRAAESLPDDVTSSVGRHLPGSIGDADVSWEVDVPDGTRAFIDDVRASARQSSVELLDTVVLGKMVSGAVRAPDLSNGIKRTLLLRVEPTTPASDVDAFERALLGMPRHIPAIRNWRLSRVARSDGVHGWTHAWEQEYETLAGLQDDYMNSPYHWGFVDGWFDAEDPRCIVAPDLFHVFFEIESSILSRGLAA